MGNETAKRHLDQANKYVSIKKYDRADYHFRKMIEAFPTWSIGHLTYIRFLKDHGRTEEIEAAYRHALSITPNSSDFHYRYAIFLSKHKRTKEAIEEYRLSIQCLEQNPNAHHNLAILLKNEEKLEQAEFHYARAFELNPKDAGTCFNFAILLQKLQKWEQAEKMYHQAICNEPSKFTAYYNLGLMLKRQGRFEEAEHYYQKALQLEPNSADAFFNYGVLYESIGKQKQALDMYSLANEADPSFVPSLYNKAVMIQKTGKISDAAGLYKKILSIDGENSDAAFNLALLLKRQGQAGRNYAEKYYEIVRKKEEKSPLYLCSRAENLFGLGHKTEALECLAAAADVMSCQSTESLQAAYSIDDVNFEFIGLLLKEFNKFRYIEQISDKLEVDDRATLDTCEQDFFKSITEPMLCSSQSEVRQSFVEFGDKYDRKFEELQRKYNMLLEQNEMLMKKLSDFSDKLMWEDAFDERLYELEQEGQEKVATFARNLCWMLTTSIQAYRAIGIGVLQGGGNLLQSKAGSFVESMSHLCGVGAKIPIVGNLCKLFCLLGEVVVHKDREHCGQKIIDVTSRLYSEGKVLKAVTESVLFLISNSKVCKQLAKEAEEDMPSKLKRKFKELNQEIMEAITGIKMGANDELALVYCMGIMANLLQIDGKPPNPVLQAARVLESAL